MIVGVDEVGRGCWAGPVCVGAVVACPEIEGLVDDSKKLLAPQRQVISQLVKEQTSVSLGWASAAYIDEHGIIAALRYAARVALAGIRGEITEVLLDGNHEYIGDPRVKTLVGGDAAHPAIGAASVVAKVARDQYMVALHNRFPAYAFDRHVGYGTAAHRAALQTNGPCLVHRMSYSPMKGLASVN